MRPRSYLFVPGDRPERFEKGLSSGAHAVVLDLEDAVAASAKGRARAAIADFLNPMRAVIVRINALEAEGIDEDFKLCALPGVVAIMLPKAANADAIRHVVSRIGTPRAVLPLIESAEGMDQVEAIAHAPGVTQLVFGSLDFQQDLDIIGDGDELLMFRSRLVLASRLAGIASPCDGVTTEIKVASAVFEAALRARRLGFGAKLCIHPSQVASVNQAFAPSLEQIAWARSIAVASAGASHGVVMVDGKMVDRPVIEQAKRLLSDAGLNS